MLGELRIGIAVGSFVSLLQNDIAFGRDILGRNQQTVHPVGFQLHDGLEMFRRHPLIVPCVIGSGERVLDPSDRLDDPVDFARSVSFRASEHHVLDEMGDSGFPRRLVGGADAVQDHVRDRRRPVVLDDDDLHSVFQPELDRRSRGGQLLRARQQQSGHNDATNFAHNELHDFRVADHCKNWPDYSTRPTKSLCLKRLYSTGFGGADGVR